MSRYARQICLPEIGRAGQARLAAARVLVIGAGGLGATVLPLLAGAGVGALRIVDHDRIEERNLHRQTLFRMADLGRHKAQVAADTLAALNPDCAVSALVARLHPEMAGALITNTDLVVDAADSFAVTYALSDICAREGKPLISASVLGRAGYVGGFCAGAPSYRALFPDLPARLQTCASGGVMGPAVATLAALQAQMALSVLLGLTPSPLGQVLTLDLADWRITGFRFDAAPEPEGPQPAILSATQLHANDLVIELRDRAEAPALPVPQALRITPDQMPGFAPDPDCRVVFSCATGLRAWRAAMTLGLSHGNPTAILMAG